MFDKQSEKIFNDIFKIAAENSAKHSGFSANKSEYPSYIKVDQKTGRVTGTIIVPGFSSAEISAEYDNGSFVISGYRKNETLPWSPSFKRKIPLSERDYDISTAEFSVDYGVLTFTVDAVSSSSSSRSFTVK